jgi:hypothetical protein
MKDVNMHWYDAKKVVPSNKRKVLATDGYLIYIAYRDTSWKDSARNCRINFHVTHWADIELPFKRYEKAQEVKPEEAV